MMRARILLAGMLVLLAGVSAHATLSTTFSATGNLGAEVAAFPTAGANGNGNLTLSSIPLGATILQATLYGNNYFNSVIMPSAVFAGTNLGTTSAYAVDADFSSYHWDVTSLITGNGTYAASFSGTTNSYGLALSVVFSHASLPFSHVMINDGAIDVPVGSPSSTSFNAAFGGAATVWLHTLADNNGPFNQSGEEIFLNGVLIGGPIDSNLGPFASLLELPGTAVAGLNTLQINDPNEDRFGWDLAVMVVSGEQVAPEPGSLALLGLGLGLSALVAVRRRRR